MSAYDYDCPHLFARRGWWRYRGEWRIRRRWRCIMCGFQTRTYDGIDRRMTRPVHPLMTVAYPGFNTVRPSPDPEKGTPDE